MLLVLAVMAFVPVGVWAQSELQESPYNLWIQGVAVTDDNKNNILSQESEIISYNPETNVLTLDNATITGTTLSNGCILSGRSELTISLIGSNTIASTDSCTAIRGVGEGDHALTIVKGGDFSELVFSVERCIRDFSSFSTSGLYWNGNFAYVFSQEMYNGNKLMDAEGNEASKKYSSDGTISFMPSLRALSVPFFYSSPLQGAEGVSFGFEGFEDQPIYYSIDYADATIADVTSELYSSNNDNFITSPCTLTAWSQYGDERSETVTAKYFGLAENSLTILWGQSVAVPDVIPAIGANDGIGVSYVSSEESVATVSNGKINAVGQGRSVITVNLTMGEIEPYQVMNNDGYIGTLHVSVEDGATGIRVFDTNNPNGLEINLLNREDVLGDKLNTVKFDGHNRLILNNANLTGITVDGTNTLPETGLEIYLVGTENVVTGNIVSNVETHTIPLAFTTNEAAPGKLTVGPDATGANAFQGFAVKYLNNLKAVTNGADAATTTTVQTKLTLALVVDEENETVTTDYDSVTPDGEHKNVTIDGIMYTLNDKGEANDPDGFVGEDGLVLNSTVNADQLNTAMNSDPGSDAFIAAFKGLTFLLPPGTGTVTLKGAYSNTGSVLCVKFGNQEPVEIKLTTDKIDYDIPYAVEQSTYGYIYLPASSSGAPAMMATRVPDRRIGPKSSVAGGLGGLSIKSSSIDVPAAPAASYMMCSKDMMATQMASLSEGNAEDGFSFGVSDITDLSDDVFWAGSASAPRRAAGYALPEKLTFIDLSETKIMGMEVSRISGPFKDVPNNTFIYMPAGNTVAADTKNVVIGSVCSDMELNGATGSTDLFKAKKSFTAAKATLKRSFTKDELATVCLPYSIMASDAAELGEFYTVTSVSSSAATLSSPVTGNLSASTAYVVKPSDNKTDLVAKSAVVSTDSPNGSTLVGVFKRTDYTSGNWYCYAGEEKGDIKVGQFVKMKDGAYVPPFRAYLMGEGSAPTLSLLWEGQDNDNNVTAVQHVKATGGQQAREGWWTLNGIRLNGQPAKAGMYVNNGRLVIVK